jgi:hypothetical protein
MYLEVCIVALAGPPPADLSVFHGSESKLHGPSNKSIKSAAWGARREGKKGTREKNGAITTYEGALILYFLTLDLVGVSGARDLSLA